MDPTKPKTKTKKYDATSGMKLTKQKNDPGDTKNIDSFFHNNYIKRDSGCLLQLKSSNMRVFASVFAGDSTYIAYVPRSCLNKLIQS